MGQASSPHNAIQTTCRVCVYACSPSTLTWPSICKILIRSIASGSVFWIDCLTGPNLTKLTKRV